MLILPGYTDPAGSATVTVLSQPAGSSLPSSWTWTDDSVENYGVYSSYMNTSYTTNLPDGDYEFEIQWNNATNSCHNISPISSSFTVTLSCNATAAPIELVSFTAQAQGNAALLQWTTATEINNKGFSVERSADAQTWTGIGFVNSQATNGNSSSSLNYSFTDNNPAAGINYYRIKQEDLNGNASYSPVKNLDFGIKATIHPNPASSQLNVMVAANSNYQLINILGRTALSGSFNAGNNSINVSGIADGVYILRVTAGGSASAYKVEVKR